MSWGQKQIALHRHRFPPFTSRLLEFPGWTTDYQIRPNRVLLRPYQPKGLTPGGIFLERNEKWPPIFGHVLAVAEDNSYGLYPGDFVCFKHLTESELYDEDVKEPFTVGDRAQVVLVHVESIRFIFHPSPVKLKL